MAECANVRVGKLIDRVYTFFTDLNKGYLTEAHIIDFFEMVHEDLAVDDYWKTWETLNVVADQYEYDLTELLEDYESMIRLSYLYDEKWYPLEPTTNLHTIMEAHSGLARYEPCDMPVIYNVNGNVLYVWPTPTKSITDGWQVYYSFMPPEVTCEVDYELPIPSAHNNLYVYGALMMAYEKDKSAPRANEQWQKFAPKYQNALAKIKHKSSSRKMRLTVR